VAVNTSDADGTEASVPYYLLGGTVKLPSSVSFNISDSIAINKVTLDIQGPQPRTIDLPWKEGAFSYSFPHTQPSGNTTETLSGTVTWTNVGWDGSGYGYANPSGAQATISYTINWKPPLLKDPPPPQPPPSLPGYTDAWPTPMVPGNLPVRGLAYQGPNGPLYILVPGPIFGIPGIPDGTPQDAILKVDPNNGNLQDAFITPGNNMQALEYFQNSLYVAQDTGSPSQLYRLNPADGTVMGGWPVTIPDPLGGLTNDGVNLLGGSLWGNQLYTLNPNDGSVVGFGPQPLDQPYDPGQGMFGGPIPPTSGLAYYAQDNNLLWASMGEIWRIDMGGPSPAVQGKEMLQPSNNMEGLTMISGTVYMGGFDPPNNKVYKAKHPNSPPTESTVAGDYTATLTLTTNPSTYTSTPVNFKLKKIDSVVITITSPSDQFASQTSSTTVTGTVNDPSISQVTVGSGAGLAEFIKDNVETVEVPSNSTTQDLWQPSGMWHVSNDRALKKNSDGTHVEVQGTGNQSWAYNQPSQSQFGPPINYDTPGQANSGFLESKTTYSVGGKSKLAFWTAWNTEPDPTWDHKKIEVFVDGSWQTVAQIVEWGPGLPPPPFVMPPFMPGGSGLPPFGVIPDAKVVDLETGSLPKLVQVPQFTWQQVVLDFGERYKDKNIKIRFKFDTGDPWANEMEGWYIDRIRFKGESLLGEAVPVVNGAFTTPFTLGEGTNIIVVTAQSAYPPNLTGTAQVSGAVDTTAPAISFDAYNAVSGTASVTISGTVTEANPDTLTMTQTTSGGTKPEKDMDTYDTQTGAFSIGVILSSGDNTLAFKATDKAGWQTTSSIVINYDVIGPTITAKSTLYPVGEVSARPGDFFIFQVDASDAQSGMDKVQMLIPEQNPNLTQGWTSAQITALDAGNEVTITSGSTSTTYQKISGTVYQLHDFKKAADIPQAVRTQWGVSGTVTDRYLFPMNLPSSAPPGTYSLTARAKDKGGNTSTATLSATVVSTLSAFNIYLMPGPDPTTPSVPGWNLISTPVIPDDTAIDTVFSGLDAQGLMSVWYYDTATSTWQSYDPDPNVPDSLTVFTTGKGYWVKMDTAQFTYDDPMATGLPKTPRPVKLTLYGTVLKPGQVPPTYPVKAGWNLIGLHSENGKQVNVALKSLTSTFGASKWGSLLQYKNYIKFPTQPGEEPETVLGSFESLGSTDSMNPGAGFWLFAMEDGTIVP
jgi:hypothetical protein